MKKYLLIKGGVPEWTKGTDCKSADRKVYVGSNPTSSKKNQIKNADVV